MDGTQYMAMVISACVTESAREARCMQLQVFIAPEGGTRQVLRLTIVPDRCDQQAQPKAELTDVAPFFARLHSIMNDIALSRGSRMKHTTCALVAGPVTVRVRVIVAPEQMEFSNAEADQGAGAAAARAMMAGKPMPPKPVATNRPTRPPDIEGRLGRAWRVTARGDGPADWQACLGAYLVEAPFAHPIWSHYMVSAVHLRDIDGVKAAEKLFPDAAYEFSILALEPNQPLPDIDGSEAHPPSVLRPADLMHQVAGGVTDEQMTLVLEDQVRVITMGMLSPDSDFRETWKQVLDAAAAHYRAGAHGVN
jgi:hypothetical protein